MGDYHKIEKCRACHADAGRLKVVLEMAPMPLAGQFCPTAEEALSANRFPLTWVKCFRCGAVQVLEDVNDDVLFTEYNYSSSTVPGLVRHFEGYAGFLGQRFGTGEPVKLLEIGCNDGVLLNRLPAEWDLHGVDPSDVALRAAKDSRYELINTPWSPELVEQEGLAGSLDVVTGSNCLAHITDIRSVFAGVAVALRMGGEFWVEVHDLASLLDGSQWDTIYHEHKLEWSEDALVCNMESLGLRHVETHKLPLHGGLLRVGFRKESGVAGGFSDSIEMEPGLEELADAYRRRYEHPSVGVLLKAQEEGMKVGAYGASGRANVYLNQLIEFSPAYIVDESPLRAGKFIPCRGTPVVSRERLSEEPVSHCLITAWNYRDDIVAKNPDHGGQWLTAFE